MQVEEEIRPSILERKGCPLHYWLTGEEGRPLVVFTHGALVDHHTFDPQLAVVAHHYRVLSWDVRGHGQSQPMGVPFTVREAVEDLVALLDVVGERQAILVGQSMGGNIAQEMAFLHPERVIALVALDCTCNTLKLSAIEHAMLRLARPLFHLYPYELLKKQSAQQSAVKPEVRQYLYKAMSQLTKDACITIMLGTSLCLHYEPGYTITQRSCSYAASMTSLAISKPPCHAGQRVTRRASMSSFLTQDIAPTGTMLSSSIRCCSTFCRRFLRDEPTLVTNTCSTICKKTLFGSTKGGHPAR